MVVEGGACGEVGHGEALDAGHAGGQGLDGLAEAGQVASKILAQALGLTARTSRRVSCHLATITAAKLRLRPGLR